MCDHNMLGRRFSSPSLARLVNYHVSSSCMHVVVEFILLFSVLLMNTIFQHEASPLDPKLQTLLLRLMATGLGTLGLQVADALLFCVGDMQMSNVYTNYIHVWRGTRAPRSLWATHATIRPHRSIIQTQHLSISAHVSLHLCLHPRPCVWEPGSLCWPGYFFGYLPQ